MYVIATTSCLIRINVIMTEKVFNFNKNVCYVLIVSLSVLSMINHSMHQIGQTTTKTVKNECKIAVKNGEYLTQKNANFINIQLSIHMVMQTPQDYRT